MTEIEKIKERAATILECWLATCDYCRASAESGQTTMHSCPAQALKVMHDETIGRLEALPADGSSSVETQKGVEALIAALPRPILHMLSDAVTQYMENTEDVYETNAPMPTSLAAELVSADSFLDAVNAQIASAADGLPAASASSSETSSSLET